jgi:hypothetical protein
MLVRWDFEVLDPVDNVLSETIMFCLGLSCTVNFILKVVYYRVAFLISGIKVGATMGMRYDKLMNNPRLRERLLYKVGAVSVSILGLARRLPIHLEFAHHNHVSSNVEIRQMLTHQFTRPTFSVLTIHNHRRWCKSTPT